MSTCGSFAGGATSQHHHFMEKGQYSTQPNPTQAQMNDYDDYDDGDSSISGAMLTSNLSTATISSLLSSPSILFLKVFLLLPAYFSKATNIATASDRILQESRQLHDDSSRYTMDSTSVHPSFMLLWFTHPFQRLTDLHSFPSFSFPYPAF